MNGGKINETNQYSFCIYCCGDSTARSLRRTNNYKCSGSKEVLYQ